MSSSKFAKSQLQKHGWVEGSGLGKNESGITEAIKVRIKNDTKGVGHDPGAEFTFQWWDHVFNKAASNISVNNTQEAVHVEKSGNLQVSSSKPTTRAFANKEVLYGRFIKAATLDDGIETHDKASSDSESEDDIKTAAVSCTDEEMLRICGGRTAHKGARHGLKANGKLARIEQQEKALLLLATNTAQGKPKGSEGENVDFPGTSEERSSRKKKKQKKQKKEKECPSGDTSDSDSGVKISDSDNNNANEQDVPLKKKKSKKQKKEKQSDCEEAVSQSTQDEEEKRSKKKKKKKSRDSDQEQATVESISENNSIAAVDSKERTKTKKSKVHDLSEPTSVDCSHESKREKKKKQKTGSDENIDLAQGDIEVENELLDSSNKKKGKKRKHEAIDSESVGLENSESPKKKKKKKDKKQTKELENDCESVSNVCDNVTDSEKVKKKKKKSKK